MKTAINSIFNDDGDDAPINVKRRFLAQRKWILLASTTHFALISGILSLKGRTGFFELNIDQNAKHVLFALAASGLLFSLYMLLAGYAFIKKYAVEKRQEFDKLQLSQSDTFSEKINSLQTQIDERQAELATHRETIADQTEELSRVDRLLDSANKRIDEIAGATSSIQSTPVNVLAGLLAPPPPQATEGLLGINAFSNEYSSSNLTNPNSWTSAFQEAQSQKLDAKNRKQATETRLSQTRKLIELLEAESEASSSELIGQQQMRASLLKNNQSEWDSYFRVAIAADCVALIPTVIGSAYCITQFFLELLTGQNSNGTST